jgi:type IV pilus assembly protein PilA
MFDRIKTRLASEEGFTLIELLVVIIILGILVAIAVPAYLSFTGSAHDAAAKANVRSAIPAAETIYEQNGNYSTVSVANLKAAAPGVSVTDAESLDTPTAGSGYCLDDTNGSSSFYYVGGNPTLTKGTIGQITTGTCAADVA